MTLTKNCYLKPSIWSNWRSATGY